MAATTIQSTAASRPIRAAVSWLTSVEKVLLIRPIPPYSPNFNPIEQAFAKLKGRLRTAAARTVDDLHAAIRETLKHFTAIQCRNYIEAAGYETDLAVSE